VLVYLFTYLLAAILLFQGVNLLGEQTAPTGVVPAEVRPVPAAGQGWGRYLATIGAVLAAAALLAQAEPALAGLLRAVRGLACASLAVYGLWLVFAAGKVDYLPAPTAPGSHGH
jgi:hypothetical protein